MLDFVLCIPLLYNSQPQGLPQSTTKWQGSHQALTFHPFTAVCGPSHLRKTWIKYQMETQDFSIMVRLLVQLFSLMHSKHWLRCLILRPSLHAYFAIRHLWCKIASSIYSSLMCSSPIYWAEHAWCSNFMWRYSQQHFLKICRLCAAMTVNEVMSVIHIMVLSIWRMGTSSKITPRVHLVNSLLQLWRDGGLVLPKQPAFVLRKS